MLYGKCCPGCGWGKGFPAWGKGFPASKFGGSFGKVPNAGAWTTPYWGW